MKTGYLQLTAYDPIVARDSRPFGVGQGNRMKSLTWLYPSVVAGSFRTALVKATNGDFSGDTPQKLVAIRVAGVFPVAEKRLYLPAPNDCVVDRNNQALPACPQNPVQGGCDFPVNGLLPVMLTEQQAKEDFKSAEAPAWWPTDKLADWLTNQTVTFDNTFLSSAPIQIRDHVQLEADTGAAAENRLFATSGLSLTHLPRFGGKEGLFAQKYAAITLSARVEAHEDWDITALDMLHPLGGERRLVHWQANGDSGLWNCPPNVRNALNGASKVRMVLATPAVFANGWRPQWIDKDTLIGSPPNCPVQLKLVGVCIRRWQAVSGWSLAEPHGPKPIKRLVPSGGVYFFDKMNGDAEVLAEHWLQPVSDDPQDRNDGFGLAVWGTWS